MTTITVRIPTPLRAYTGGRDEVEVAGETVGAALTALGSTHHGLLERVLGPDGQPRQFVNVFLGGNNVRALDGMRTPLQQGDVIAIVPAVAGGGGGGPAGGLRATGPTLNSFAARRET